jgi:hypothetical protein
VIADEPVAYWRLGEAYRTQFAEEQVNDLDGIYLEAQPGVDGLLIGDSDTAVSLIATAIVSVETSSLRFTGRQPFTIEAWIKADSLSSGHLFASMVSYPGQMHANGYDLFISNAELCLSRANAAIPDENITCIPGLSVLTPAYVVRPSTMSRSASRSTTPV